MDREYRQREKEDKERLTRQAEHEDEQLEKNEENGAAATFSEASKVGNFQIQWHLS